MSPASPALSRFRKRNCRSSRPATRRPLVEQLEDRSLLAALQTLPSFAPDEILIGLKDDLPRLFRNEGSTKALQSAATHLGSFGLSRGEVLANPNAGVAGQDRLITRWKLPSGKDIAALASQLSKLPRVAYAEPNYIWTAASISSDNDALVDQLWGLDNIGQSGGTLDADIDAPEAWSLSGAVGSREVVVGIIDTGVDYNHPDLAANIWRNPGETPGNGIDDDGNGYVDDIHGINAITGSGNPMDDNNHGTHVAGTIGAVGNNNVGVVGVNHQVSIVAGKFLDANGSGTTADAIECFNYFNNLKINGVNIVVTNNSWGGGGFSQALLDAMRGPIGMTPILHAVAAGNSNSNNDATPSYPSNYALDHIISVAATDRFDKYASFSSYGANSVDLAAPGVSILSTTRTNTYSSFSGTSMATPHVAGAAALAYATYSELTDDEDVLTALELKQHLASGADLIGGIGTNSSKPTLTNGRLNIHQTLINLTEVDNTPPAAVSDLTITGTGLVAATLTWTASGDDGTTGTAKLYDVRYSTAQISEANWAAATRAFGAPRPQSAGAAEVFTLKGLERNTTYYFAVKVLDNKGNESPLSNVATATTLLGTTILADNFESGLGQWTAQSPWATTTTQKHLGSKSATDSPSGTYANYANTSLTSRVLDLSSIKETQLSFWHRYDFEQGYDFGRVEISTNGGASWGALASYTGAATTFQKVTFDLSGYSGQSSVKVRFRVQSDNIIRKDGWYVDDVEIAGLEAPGIRVTPAATLVTTESGGTATFSVALAGGPPTHNVVIPISSSNLAEGNVSTSSLTFTPLNWSTAQTVIVTGADDTTNPQLDGDHPYTIITDPAQSADLLFNGIDPLDLSATNKDNETKFYVVNDGTSATSERTYEYASGGLAGQTYQLTSGNTVPRGAASTAVGDKVWVVDANKRVYVYNPDGVVLGSWAAGSLPSNANVQGVATNGTDIWIVDAQGDRVHKYAGAATRLSGSQNAASSFILNSGNRDATDLVTGGANIWVLNNTSSTDKVFKYTLAGALAGSWTITSGGGSPTGITLDPAVVSSGNMWIVDSATDRIYQFNAATSLTSGSLAPATSFALAAGNTNPQGLADPPVPLSGPRSVSSVAHSSFDAALLAIINELDSSLSGGKKRR